MNEKITIREASENDLEDVLFIESAAFGKNDEAELVKNLLSDPSAQPSLSIIALKGDRPVGHILFTKAILESAKRPVSTYILAPLAIIPDAQNQGIGGLLIAEGLVRLKKMGVELVFVLGHPDYYPRHGFNTAGCRGFEAPYPIPEKDAGAWMVQALQDNVIGAVTGKVRCADTLNRPEYWRE
ncbi:MAG: N-acetyltransferase [Candidatus Latescibacteria bacterium]|nr:N-acetyltransferase [Candidatus Latescibacterota bacterium]